MNELLLIQFNKTVRLSHDSYKLGIPRQKAYEWANTRKGYWRISRSPVLQRAISNSLLESRGYRSLVSYYDYRHTDLMNRRDTRTVRPVV